MDQEKNWISVLYGIGKKTVVMILLGSVIYIMVHHLGLADNLDFGAGAYYYADIPGFSRLINNHCYTSETPMWILTVLLLIWGSFMYRLWIWIEKKS